MNQLALFEMSGDDPMPLLVAQKYHFPLQHHEAEGEKWFAIQDWVGGVAKTDNPSDFWHQMKKRMARAKTQTSITYRSLPYHAADGKTYKREFATDEGLYLITQRMGVDTGIAAEVLKYLAKAGVFADKVRRNPELAIEAARHLYVRKGKSTEWIDQRLEGKNDFKHLMDAVQKVCATPDYPGVINTEYKALFGYVAKQLEIILNTKSIRDTLPRLQLSYIRAAETSCQSILEHSDKLTMAEVHHAMQRVAEPLGKALQDVCRILGVDHVTGKPLLEGAK